MNGTASIFEGHTVRFERNFPASVDRLWAHLASPEGLPTWLADGAIGPARVDLRFANNGSVVAREWNEHGNCGLVVGATYPREQ